MDSSGHMTIVKLLNEEILEVPILFSLNFVLPAMSLEDSATQVSLDIFHLRFCDTFLGV